MNLFIDCEFNGFNGDLVSMALVPSMGEAWYQVIPCENPCEWVAKNVIPYLVKPPLKNQGELSTSLYNYLSQFDKVHIIADWPDDIKYFCQALIIGPGERIDTPPITMEIDRELHSSNSRILHNALEDARAIRKVYNERRNSHLS